MITERRPVESSSGLKAEAAETSAAIFIIGNPRVAGLAADTVFPAKGFQLLALLARAPSCRLARKLAAEFLWDSDTEAGGLTNLRQLLIRIRKCLPQYPQLVLANTTQIELGTDSPAIDLCQLSFRVEKQTATLADLALARGNLLDGTPDSTDRFAHWLTAERTLVNGLFLTLATSSLVEMTRYGRARPAGLDQIAKCMLDLEPEREATYRTLIEAYGRNGDFTRVDRLMRDCEAMLAREHGAKPAPETAAVARRMLSYRSEPAAIPVAAGALAHKPRVAFLKPALIGETMLPGLLHALIEDAANELSRYRSFVTLAPHSSFQIDHDSGQPADNRILRADYAISGFLKPDGRGCTLALRMVHCSGSDIIWSAEFRFGEEHLVQTSRRLVIQIASGLAEKLEQDILERTPHGVTKDAYLHYLEGQQLMMNCDLPKLRQARKSFFRAAECDRHFAPAYGRLSQSLYLEWIMLGGNDPGLLHKARDFAGTAIEIDGHLAIGHWMKGVVALYQRDFDLSEEQFATAEILSPNAPDLLVQYADALSYLGTLDAAWERFERAIDINPMPPDHYWWAGASIAFLQSDYQRAIDLCAMMISDEPVTRLLAASHALKGDLPVAKAYGRRVRESFPGQQIRSLTTLAPFKQQELRDRFEQGLRLSGV